MSKNKSYDNFYKNPLVVQPAEEKVNNVLENHVEENKDPFVIETEVRPDKIVEYTAAIVKGAAKVNLRSSDSIDASVVAIVPENTAVKILDDASKYWFKVEVKDKVGYMMSRFLKRV